jgi:hypothetical protein
MPGAPSAPLRPAETPPRQSTPFVAGYRYIEKKDSEAFQAASLSLICSARSLHTSLLQFVVTVFVLKDSLVKIRSKIARPTKPNLVVANEIVGIGIEALVCQHFELGFRGPAVIQPEMVARFEVDRHCRLRMGLVYTSPIEIMTIEKAIEMIKVNERVELNMYKRVESEFKHSRCHSVAKLSFHLKINRQDFQAHVVVVELVVAHGDEHVEGQVVPVFQQQPLVNVGSLLEVGPQVVNGGQGQLVFLGVAQLLVPQLKKKKKRNREKVRKEMKKSERNSVKRGVR